jgi:purine-binding chemotaxis protein CheW
MNAATAFVSSSTRASEAPTGSAQYLTFSCADEEYGVDILRVQEIRGWSAVTCLPGSPNDMMGVLHLRGTVVPVIGLRTRFGLDARAVDASTVVIVLRVEGAGGGTIIGICVDGVSDVNTVDTSSIMAPPDFGGGADEPSVSGLVTLNGRTVMLLNIDRLFGTRPG